VAATANDVYVGLYPIYALNPSDGTTLWTSYHVPNSSLVAAGNAIYLMDLSAAGRSSLIALNAGDGTELWTHQPANSISTPVMADGVVYVLGIKQLHAVRASDGARIWDSPGPDGGWLATDGTVVCGVYGAPITPVQPGDELWAWRASDGTRLWRSAAGGFGPPAMAAGVIYVVSADGKLHALRARDGANIWDYPANIQTTPAVANGRVYVGSSAGGLIALRASDGTPMWEFTAQISIGPVVAGPTVYVSNGSKVYAING
jgi:outer membrane protein assembly factor BamB